MRVLKESYNVRKAAQVGAYFAKASGGSIDVLKLVKLIYLSDRHSLSLFDLPVLNDSFVSMDRGPVNSGTYDRLKRGASLEKEWQDFLAARRGNIVSLAQSSISIDDLDELSRADLRVLGEVWGTYGHMDSFKLAELTHEICPEWSNPNGSSAEIPLERIFKFLGRENSEELAEAVREQNNIERAFSACV